MHWRAGAIEEVGQPAVEKPVVPLVANLSGDPVPSADRLERPLVPLLQPIVDECVSCVHDALDLPGHVPPPCPSLRRPCRLRSSHASGRAASTTSPSVSR